MKEENILCTTSKADDFCIKLTDFGVARELDSPSAKLTSQSGTYKYMAPEICKGEPYDCKVDVWAVGVVAFKLLTGRMPFAEKIDATKKDTIFK